MAYFIQLLAALAGSLGFGMLFNIHGKKLAYAASGGFMAWGVYLVSSALGLNDYLSAMTACVALTLYSECMARALRAPVTVFLVPSAIPLIPGASLYYAARALMLQQWELAAEKGLYALLFAASMSAGITLTSVLFQMAARRIHGSKST